MRTSLIPCQVRWRKTRTHAVKTLFQIQGTARDTFSLDSGGCNVACRHGAGRIARRRDACSANNQDGSDYRVNNLEVRRHSLHDAVKPRTSRFVERMSRAGRQSGPGDGLRLGGPRLRRGKAGSLQRQIAAHRLASRTAAEHRALAVRPSTQQRVFGSRHEGPTRLSLTFRCPKELDGLLPVPIPAALGLPDWLKAMPQQAFSAIVSRADDTVKRCPPFVDAMTGGFLIPLIGDVNVENGEFTWDSPCGSTINFERAPIGFHDPSQVTGTPLFNPDHFPIKFHKLWTIEAPTGYALLFTHPVNRFDLPFTTLTGMVDSDRYRDAWIHFPARWHDVNFSGVLPKGTPVAQCFPINRETWAVRTAAFTEEETQRTHDLIHAIGRERGAYRRQFRA